MARKALFGRYLPGESPVHRLDPRTKLVLTAAVMVVAFCAQSPLALGVCAVGVIAFYAAARIPLGQAVRAIAPLLFIVAMTALLNLLFVQGGETLAAWGPFRISEAGASSAAFLSCRLTLLLAAATLLTLTTTALDLTDALERLLFPLARLGLPVHELATMMGIALRFLPQFADELVAVHRAQASRGARFSDNPLRAGAAAVSSLIVPLFASAFRHADTLSLAMDARCYRSDGWRTRLHPLALSRRDAAGAAAVAALFAAVVLANLAPQVTAAL